MYRDFVITVDFDYYWNAIGLADKDPFELQNILLENPQIGNVIPGTGGCRKMRYSLADGGKRGGSRIIYLDVPKLLTTYLLLVYPKSVKDNLTQQEKRAIATLASQLKEACDGK